MDIITAEQAAEAARGLTFEFVIVQTGDIVAIAAVPQGFKPQEW